MTPARVVAGLGAASVGWIVIGRNEGERLVACLRALQRERESGRPVIYVDSGSHDGSARRAAALCDSVHELDPARPFSAARARNEGAQLIASNFPALLYLQFLDGDCLQEPDWADTALAALDVDPRLAVVIGHLRERDPDSSIYNRLCALEWASPAGIITNFGALGGIMMVRRSVFERLGGFRPEVIAGEDSEFGVRVAEAGFVVRKLDAPMAWHDADIHRFSQWWTRAVRAGHAIGQRASLHAGGTMRDCARERRSTWFWGVALPLLALLLVWPSRGWSLLLLGGYAVLGWRIFRFRRHAGDRLGDSLLYTRYNLMAKLANGIGLLRFESNRLRGKFRIIEYK